MSEFGRVPAPAVNDAVANDDAPLKEARKRKTPMNLPHKHPPGREPPDLPPKPEPEPDTRLHVS